MTRRLSKSKFQKGLQCERALWLAVHDPGSADATSESQQWVFDQGTEVGRLAHGLFPGGVEVTEDHRQAREALATTGLLVSQGATVLYEPAFLFDGVLVRVDILVRSGDSWDLYEVKSTASLKPEHVTDAAIQTYVVEGSGLRVRRSHIVHLNTSYIFEGGEYDLERLFTIEDVTQRAREYMWQVPGTIEHFRTVLEGPEPQIRVGSRCRVPYGCDFAGRCHAFLPEAHPVTQLPRLSESALHALLDMGVTCIRDIPDSFEGLTRNQSETVAVVKSGSPSVDVVDLKGALSALEWPIHHLDFETVNPALPLWPNTRPYQVVPFQYSIHVHHEDGRHEHREYLHVSSGDPRRALAERMLSDLGEHGSITHYTPYEIRVLDGLAAALPDLAGPLSALHSRLVDLEPIIRSNTKHPDACGRTSIKYVLPAWCPGMSYEGLGISDGQTASVRYLRVAKGMTPLAETERVFADLIEYCGQDTLAMVRLLDRMRALGGG
jgi:hypothetical protein